MVFANKILFAAFVAGMICVGVAVSQEDEASDGSAVKPAMLLPSALLSRTVDMVKNKPTPETTSAGYVNDASAGRVFETRIESRMLKNSPVRAKNVKAFSSSNGGNSWKATDLAEATPERLAWRGKPGGSMISVYAVNDVGSAVSELKCMEKKGLPLAQSSFGSGDPRPKGCTFTGGPEELPIDDPPAKAGEDLDMLDFRVGYDAKYVYFAMMVEGEISAGSLTPLVFNEYGIIAMNPESEVTTTEGALPLDGAYIRYVPMGMSVPSLVKACGAVVYKNKTLVLDTESVTCTKSNEYVLFKVKRSLWGKKPVKELLVSSHTATLRESGLAMFSFVDYTNITRLKFIK